MWENEITTTTIPGRLASLESDVLVPVLQSLSVSVSIGIGLGVSTLLLGGPVGDLVGPDLWSWSGRVLGLGTVLSLGVSVVVFILQTRRSLQVQPETRRERGEVEIRDPEVVKVEIDGPRKGQTRYVDLPVGGELSKVGTRVLRRILDSC